MAPRCRIQSRECDGCGACMGMYGDEETYTPAHPPRCEECHEEIEDGYYYDVEGTVLCEHCMDRLYRKEAS